MSLRSRSRSQDAPRQEGLLVRVSALSGSLLLERRFSKDEVIAKVRETVQQEAKEPLTQLKLIQEKGDKELPEGARLDELPLNNKGFLDLTALRTPAHCALVGFGDGTLRLWDLERGALARNLLPAGPAVSGVSGIFRDWHCGSVSGLAGSSAVLF
ncbi:UBI1 [Symbiodinium natans]|uniref:UBI1 protein n=1 Tax=Symbiodinium natans TaxID=878477 RepID=A0A812RWG8_9DINO|nr:UBI1 [Symbiodinium natans]